MKEKANNYLRNSRRDYAISPLTENELHAQPLNTFNDWFNAAVAADITDAHSFVLATANSEGKPSTRVVLLRDFDENGFVFYTNYLSKKGEEIASNPNVALNFYWFALNRQIRIEGSISKISKEVSQDYFKTRPRNSQIGAVISTQSAVVPNREFLDTEFKKVENQYIDKEIPMPKDWGGYLVKPSYFEFWQGRPNRVHDRFRYTHATEGWKMERLAP